MVSAAMATTLSGGCDRNGDRHAGTAEGGVGAGREHERDRLVGRRRIFDGARPKAEPEGLASRCEGGPVERAEAEIVIFDRSWYNRAGVERVMGFCTPEQTDAFLKQAPRFEKLLVDDGILLFKYWLAVDQDIPLHTMAAA